MVTAKAITKVKKNTHCESCGEWLEGYSICSECGYEITVTHQVQKLGT